MTSLHVIVLLSALCSFQVETFSVRSLADNPFLPPPVHRHLATCPTTAGIDYLGNDIKSVSGVQVSDCCTLCSETSGCGAFTWTNYLGGTCWLKSSKGNTAPNAGATSAVLVQDQPGCTIKDGVDYQDNDIANVKGNNAGACCSICEMWPGCKAFSWSTHNGGTCWLKSKKGVEIVRSGVKSAEVETTVIVDCILQYDIDYVDNDIANVPAKYPGDCCGICMGWSGCRSFSWSNLNGGTCWLKSVMGKTVSKPGVVSCKIRDNPPSSCTLEFDVDYVGNDIRNVPRVNPDDCCYQCRDTAGCRAFSWSNFNGGTCWLKNMKGATISKSEVTSAIVF